MKRAPIRALHVIDSLDLGGAQTVLLNFAACWRPSEVALEVAAMHGRGVFAAEFEKLGIPVHSLSAHKLFPGCCLRLPALLRSKGFDVAHFHLFGANWIAKPIAAALRVPLLVSHDHCNDRLRHKKKFALLADKLTNRFSRAILAVSGSTRDFLVSFEGVPPGRVRLLYNGVCTETFAPDPVSEPFSPGPSHAKSAAKRALGLDERRPVIGGVGRLVAQKNFRAWVGAAALLLEKHPSLQFVIAGTGPEEASLRALADSLGIGRSVVFAGFVADRPSLYRALDALLITSDYEGLPMTLLEAMASGVPVVASKVDGPAEILVDGVDALLVEPGEATRFAGALSKLVERPALAAQLARNARAKAARDFSAGRQAAAVLDLYREFLG